MPKQIVSRRHFKNHYFFYQKPFSDAYQYNQQDRIGNKKWNDPLDAAQSQHHGHQQQVKSQTVEQHQGHKPVGKQRRGAGVPIQGVHGFIVHGIQQHVQGKQNIHRLLAFWEMHGVILSKILLVVSPPTELFLRIT